MDAKRESDANAENSRNPVIMTIPLRNRAISFFRSLAAVIMVSCAACADTGKVAEKKSGPVPATTEQLPVDRFDEYQVDSFPPYPWRRVGTEMSGVEWSLRAEGESALVGNNVTGKGLVMRDTSTSSGAGAGLAISFAPPPAGDVYLGFDFLLGTANDEEDGLEMGGELTDAQGRGLILRMDAREGLRVRAADGILHQVAPLKAGKWFHVGVTISQKNIASFVLLTDADLKNRDKPPEAKLELPVSSSYTLLRFFNAGDDVQSGSWSLDNIAMAGRVEAGRGAWLPFKPLPTAVLRATKRKVFAYYYPPYSSGASTSDPGLSGYVRNTLNPSVKVDRRREKAGTALFYHPLLRTPLSPSSSKDEELITAMEEEVRLAIQMGADGFLLDFLTNWKPSDTYYNQRSFAVLEAAHRVDPQFKVVPAVYSSGDQGDPVAYANSPEFKRIAESPAVLRTDDGRIVLSMWGAERNTVDWWKRAFAELERLGMPVVFIPHFNSMDHLADFSPISYGMAHWGPRTPMKTGWVSAARKFTPLVVAPIAAHDIRSRGQIYWESKNFDTLRTTWANAIEGGSDWVFIDTWSDYSEQAMAPSTAIGFSLYDLNTYYGQWFKTGTAPAVTRDVLYYSYRRHHTEIDPGRGVHWKVIKEGDSASTGSNDIQLLGFLKEPGELHIQIGDQVYTKKAAAGITSFNVPMPEGEAFTPIFSLERSDHTIIKGHGRYTVLNKVEYPNMLYHSGELVGVED
jgi:hypothetical protein